MKAYMELSLLPIVWELVQDLECGLSSHLETNTMHRGSQVRRVSSPTGGLNRENLTQKSRARRPGFFDNVDL